MAFLAVRTDARFTDALSSVEEARRAVRSVDGDQVQSKAVCGILHGLVGLYYDDSFAAPFPLSRLPESEQEAAARAIITLAFGHEDELLPDEQ
jgi:hypothetical protein